MQFKGYDSLAPRSLLPPRLHTLLLAAIALGGLSLAVPAAAPAQQTGAVTGTVRAAESLAPLSGVQVSIAGTQIGGLTDQNGQFRITGVPAGEQSVRAQLIGYGTVTQSVTVEAGQAARVELSLEVTATELDEIVVTGTPGESRRRELGNAVSSLNAEDLADEAQPASVGELLQGRASGLVAMSGSNTVGGGSVVKIRGTASLSLGGQPLIYVDGVRVNNEIGAGPTAQGYGSGMISRLEDFAPSEIERIEIVKGPAAATLYGTEANNGVIQIFTKSGSSAATRWTVKMGQGANWLDGMTDRTGYGDRGRHLFHVWGTDAETGEPRYWNMLRMEQERGTQLFRTGHLQDYTASVAGGGADATYFISGRYESDEGPYPSNSVWRLNGRTNVAFSPSEKWNIRPSLGVIKADFGLADDHWWNPLTQAMYTFPSLRNGPTRGFLSAPGDMIYEVEENTQRLDRYTGSLRIQHDPSDWFQQRLTLGVDETQEDNIVHQPFLGPEGVPFFGEVGARGQRSFEKRSVSVVTVDYSGSVTHDLSDQFSSRTSVGGQFYSNETDVAETNGVEFAAPGLKTVTSTAQRFAGEAFVRNVTVGAYAQERLSWQDRRYLTVGVRLDNNSAFGDEFSVVTYPKVSGSWVLSEEPFVDVDGLSSLRLRAAYGWTGQQPESFSALRFFLPVTAGTGEPALKPSAPGNPDLKPETGKEWEVGFDSELFGGRVDFNATYYDQVISDVLLQRPLAPSGGFPGTQWINAGKVSSRGFEVELNATAVRSEDLTWDLGLHVSRNYNEVLDVSAARSGTNAVGQDFVVRDIELDTPGLHIRHQEGFAPGAWFGYEVVSAELDEDGNATNVMCDGGPGTDHEPVPCSEAPFVYLGQSTPEVEGAVNTSVTLFDRLTLSGLVDYKFGNHHGDNDTIVQCQLFRICRENYFPSDYDPVRIAQFQSANLSTFAVADASLVKLRNVSLRYELPSAVASTIGASNASVSVSAHNLSTWTSWPSLDPENYFTAPTETSPIFDRSTQTYMPAPRRVTGVVTLNF